jgi:hypothetical protein
MKKLVSNITLFILPLIAGIVFLFLIPVDQNFSYHFVKGECDNKASWIYNRIFEQKENIDIAFTGASQTSCAIMDEYLEIELTKLTGNPTNVVNLGYCRRGRDIQFAMLNDLFQQKKPKILVIEVAEDEPKKSHPVFPYLAETHDLLSSFVFYNQRFPINIWNGIVVRFEYLKHRFFADKRLNTNHQTGKYGYLPSDQIAEPEILEKNKADWTNRLSKSKPELIRKVELNYSKHFLEKIVKLARQNNCEVVFLYLPESGSNLKYPLLKDFYQSFGKLIVLPDSILTNTQNWKDATHFNDSGAVKVSDFVGSEILDVKIR